MAAHHKFQLRSDYWSDNKARAAFKHFINQIFGIDFEPWDASGYWDNDYRPFSFFADDRRIVASACMYSLRMVIGGRLVRVGQISAMGVLPELRRQGLGGQLTEHALDWASENGHECFMLFSTEEALPFYQAQGFRFTPEHRPVLRLSDKYAAASNTQVVIPGIQALDANEPADLALLYRLACDRCPISQQLGVLNARLIMYYALMVLRGRAFYIPSLDVAVMFRRRDGVLLLYDIIGPRLPAFAELAPFLFAPGDREVAFWFMIDSLGDLASFGSLEHQPVLGNNLHLRTGFPLPSSGPFLMPLTAQA